jgi:YebC/PmpR family DNA-binding regulatory protein
MSGHSKWATIKRHKAKIDDAKGKVFSRHAREIMLAAKTGGGDPSTNTRLRLCMDKARGDGMPGENIERAIRKGTGDLAADATEEVVYEGYGPHGVAIMIDAVTDNRNRTVGEIRSAFNKYGGSLGESGCVGYQFQTKGLITLDMAGRSEDEVLEIILDAGADDLITHDTSYEVTCGVEELNTVTTALTAAGMTATDIEVARVPQHTIKLDEAQARQLLRLIDAIEESDDVQKVAANFDIDEEVMAALG